MGVSLCNKLVQAVESRAQSGKIPRRHSQDVEFIQAVSRVQSRVQSIEQSR